MSAIFSVEAVSPDDLRLELVAQLRSRKASEEAKAAASTSSRDKIKYTYAAACLHLEAEFWERVRIVHPGENILFRQTVTYKPAVGSHWRVTLYKGVVKQVQRFEPSTGKVEASWSGSFLLAATFLQRLCLDAEREAGDRETQVSIELGTLPQ